MLVYLRKVFVLKIDRGKRGNALRLAVLFLVVGVLVLVFSVFFELQVAAFVGLGLTFWGVVFLLARDGKYVESGLLDGTAKSAYSTFDRVIRDLKFNGHGYFIPPFSRDLSVPEYLKNLKEPVVFVSEKFDGKASADELAAGKFWSQNAGVFLTCPGSELMAQMEERLHCDFSHVDFEELLEFLPRCLTESFNLAQSADMSVVEGGVCFEAKGLVYESLYRADPPMKSVSLLGCPVVSAVASVLAKASGKTVVISQQVLSPGDCGVKVLFNFVEV